MWLEPQTGNRARRSSKIPGKHQETADDCVHFKQASVLTQGAARQGLAGSFWSVYLPNGRQIGKEISSLCPGSWTSAVLELQDTEPALQSIVLALGSGFEVASSKTVIVDDQISHLKHQTKWLYNRALWHLKQAVMDPSRAQSDGILATTRLLQVFLVSKMKIHPCLNNFNLNSSEKRGLPHYFGGLN